MLTAMTIFVIKVMTMVLDFLKSFVISSSSLPPSVIMSQNGKALDRSERKAIKFIMLYVFKFCLFKH